MSSRNKKECVAMLLAGGQGTRLGVLTKKVAKPAVPFGGKYRIIDFPLSNCINSGIDTVGVLTQYQPFELNQYIGNGQPWDLDRLNGGVYVLPPYVRGKSGEWYKGTANAIYQNIMFIDRFDPEYVLILSGDHIYKMDYSEMLKEHKKNGADCTIAAFDVPIDEAHRFGILNTDDNNKIEEFEEKPANPRSTKASMGIYIFNWSILRQYLIDDEANPDSENDFGKNIIPSMLNDGKNLYAFTFKGYWKDVGTVSSLWEANMDMIDDECDLDIGGDASRRIYARSAAQPPHYISSSASVSNAIISEGAVVCGDVKDSIISHGAKIGHRAKIYNSVIFPGAEVMDGAEVYFSIVGENAKIGANAKIGEMLKSAVKGEWAIALIGPNAKVGDGKTIKAGEMIDAEE